MKAFIITSMSLAALGVVFRLLALAVLKYPRSRADVTSGDDVAAIVFGAAWCAWAWHVLN